MLLRKILFAGKPGAGKGTQAKLLIPYGFRHISTGDLIREAWKREDPIVMPYKSHIEDEGGLLPDKEIFELIDKELKDLSETQGYIFDGAIRNIPQVEIALQRNLLEEVLFFDLSDEEVIRRLSRRFEEEGRKDDSPRVVQKRLRKYREQTESMVEYFIRRGIPVSIINASHSIEEIHRDLVEILGLGKFY